MAKFNVQSVFKDAMHIYVNGTNGIGYSYERTNNYDDVSEEGAEVSSFLFLSVNKNAWHTGEYALCFLR